LGPGSNAAREIEMWAAVHAIGRATMFLLAFASPARAMDFQIIRAADGQRLVAATGTIVPGDAQGLAAALRSADRDRWGNKGIGLASPGGSVAEAFAMVQVMDRERVNTIVPPDMFCASACSQILFVSGVYRVLIDGGKLGMHSCSREGQTMELCNERIAMNAVSHGVAYGSVMAFMKYTNPDQMIWFSAADADCWGLTRWPPGYNRGTEPGNIAPCVRRTIMGK
jgi:hypothetical protein